jgi:toxin ParE1/3/4
MVIAFQSLQAEQDLLEIAYQIAVTDGRPHTAEIIIDELVAKCNFYAKIPQLGTAADHLFEGCRYGRHKRWIIFYRPRPEGIDVIRIIDGARDYEHFFRS